MSFAFGFWRWALLSAAGVLSVGPQALADPATELDIEQVVAAVEPRVIAWRRDIHQHPELGNRETRTAGLVAEHLRGLGLDEVRTGIAHTGVLGVLRGGKPGPVVALRADMDALPVTEPEGLPFASRVRTLYNGQEVGVMHACGHDAHTAILMGTAEVLAGMRDAIPGTVVFIFQPAEEGAPEGEEGGAKMMLAEGLFDSLEPEAIFALHVLPRRAGNLYYTRGSTMAGSDNLKITVSGKQTHGAMPHFGIDPITVSAQIITALQTIPSRQLDAVKSPTIVSIGSIHGGVRGNIIPDQVELTGTIRTLDPESRDDVLARIKRTAEMIAESAGARAEVQIEQYSPVLHNDPELVQRMVPTLQRVAGDEQVVQALPVTPSEDFAYFSERIPGFYFFLGINKAGLDWAPPNHSPHFFINEDTLAVGVRAMSAVALDYLQGLPGQQM